MSLAFTKALDTVRLPDAWMFLLRTLVVVRRLEDLFAEEDQTPLPSTPLRDGHWELSSSTTTIRWPSIQKSSQETNTFQLRIPTLRLPEKGLVLLVRFLDFMQTKLYRY